MSGEVDVEAGAGDAGPAEGILREGSHVVDGIRAHYTVADPPDADRVPGATPLIFLHGMGASAVHFRKNLLPIAAACGAPVYAVDLIGSFPLPPLLRPCAFRGHASISMSLLSSCSSVRSTKHARRGLSNTSMDYNKYTKQQIHIIHKYVNSQASHM